MYKIPYARPTKLGREVEYVNKALHDNQLSQGEFNTKSEELFSQIHGGTSFTTSSGTTSLHLALAAIGIKRNDEVIVPGWGFGAAQNMVIHCGAIPVFADVDPNTWLVTPESIRRCVSPFTKAIVVIHTYGAICDMPAIMDIAKFFNLTVIEDCAESIFSTVGSRLCGTFGHLSCFSFHAAKTITSGEGGMLVCNQEELIPQIQLIRSQGMYPNKKYYHHIAGHNFRMTNLQAAYLFAQLEKSHITINNKIYAYRTYSERLTSYQQQTIPSNQTPVMWAFGIKTRHRDTLIQRLELQGIETRTGFYAATRQPAYKSGPLPVAEDLTDTVLTLPMPVDMGEAELTVVCNEVNGFVDPSVNQIDGHAGIPAAATTQKK